VHVAAEDEVRLLGRHAIRLAALAPFPLQRQRAEHDRLRRTLSAGPGRLAGGVEQLCQHPDAASLDLERPGVLGVVDEVAVEVAVDHPSRLGLHPGGNEGGQVALRDALDGEFLLDQSLRCDRHQRVLRDRVVGGALGQEGAGGGGLGNGSRHIHFILLLG
jgi:hypothetical protein